ncbi:hypothetical protein VULLAG_LOCUS19133 [Vulpes lagopus]
MTEDKAGWGLVPGLQAPLLHTHSAQRRPLGGSSSSCSCSCPCSCCAGRARRARCSLGSHTPHPRPATRRRPQPRSASEPQALETEECIRKTHPAFQWPATTPPA